MSYKAVFGQIMREYEASRHQAEMLFDERKKKLYASQPKLQEIDLTIAKLGAKLAQYALASDQANLEETRNQISAAKQEKSALIASLGLQNLAINYRCKRCKDTGFVQNQSGAATHCRCLKQRLISEYYSLSNLDKILNEENFDTYDFRLFINETDTIEEKSPLQNMQDVYQLASRFVENFDNSFDNLLFYGSAGLGKTFVCHCIAKDLLDRGKTVLYLPAPRLCKLIEDYRFNRESLTEPEEMLDAVDNVDLLIIDDLGAEFSTVITSAALFDIINQRLISRKHTVVSTNLAPDEIARIYSERTVSRFLGSYQLIKFFGEDIRCKKKYLGTRI